MSEWLLKILLARVLKQHQKKGRGGVHPWWHIEDERGAVVAFVCVCGEYKTNVVVTRHAEGVRLR